MSEVEVAKESFIESELKKYNITDAYIAEINENCMNLKVESVDDLGGYKIVRAARIAIKIKRVGVEKKRKELKAESLKYGRAVDSEAKRITSLLLPIENHLIGQEKIVDDEKERIRTEEERKERERTEAEDAARKQEELLLQARIREEQEAEAKRLKKIQHDQEEREAKIRQEQEKIDAELAKIEAEKREIREQREKEEQEKQDRIRIENEKQEMLERAKVEAEQLAKRKEEEKRLMEEQAKKDEESRLALLPDNEKLESYAYAIEAVPTPQLSYSLSKDILGEARDHLSDACIVLRRIGK